MSIEERVRRMLAEAVATEPAPSGAPFEEALRRRRRRPLRAAVVAMALLLAAAVVVSGVRALGTDPVPLPAGPVVPPGWQTFTNTRHFNLQFRYPPDWVVQGTGGFLVAPRQLAVPDSSGWPAPGRFGISVGLSPDYYRFVVQNGAEVTLGSLPDGRAFIRRTEAMGATRIVSYAIDWGRSCFGRDRLCGSHSVTASIVANSQALLDRYGPVAEQMVRTFKPVRPTAASVGDRRRPACRPDQWRPVFASRSVAAADTPGRWVISGEIRYRQGFACHLRTTLRLTVERADGTPVAVPGTPSPFTVEADLPENGGEAGEFVRTATMWSWGWDNWCGQTPAAARVRVTGDNGESTTRPLPPRSIQDPRVPCRPGAPWRIAPLP